MPTAPPTGCGIRPGKNGEDEADHCSSIRKLNASILKSTPLFTLNIMLKESVVAVLFIFQVAAQTPISIDEDEIAQAHNFVRRGVSPSAANMEVMVSYH